MLTHREALEVLAAKRGDHVVITTMGSVAIWPQLSDTPRDFHYLPSSMGQGVPLGLGLCLAKPGLPVAVLTGDGGLLMNLGCLVTAAQFTVPLRILLIDNGLYEVTGGQVVANAGRTDFAAIARGAGIGRVYTCATRGVGSRRGRSAQRHESSIRVAEGTGRARQGDTQRTAADGRSDRTVASCSQ